MLPMSWLWVALRTWERLRGRTLKDLDAGRAIKDLVDVHGFEARGALLYHCGAAKWC